MTPAPRSAPRLVSTTLLIGGFTFLSRILGFVRDILFASTFGASPAMDAFLVAFKIPNFFRRLFAEGAFSQAFVPVLGELHHRDGHEAARDLVAHASGTLGFVLLVFSVLGILTAPWVIDVFAPGFLAQPATHALAAGMLRWTFPYLFFIALVALSAGALNVYGHYAAPAATPILLNLTLIAATLGLTRLVRVPITALAIGVLVAGALQLAFQIPFLARQGLLARPRIGFRHPAVRRILALMLPSLFGASVMQVNLLIDTAVATFLAPGSVSWLYYADRLMEFPLGVFAVALGSVVLPRLTKAHSRRTGADFSRTLDNALRLVVLVVLPAAVGLAALAGPLLITLFTRGAFDAFDARMSAWALVAYAVGLLGFTSIKILAPGYYARQDTRTPVRIGLLAVGANLLLMAILVPLWLERGWPAPHAALALATSLAALLNAALLARGLHRRRHWRPAPGWTPLLLRTLTASALMAAVLLAFAPSFATWLRWDLWIRVGNLVAWVLAGVGVYVLGLVAAGLRPRHVRDLLEREEIAPEAGAG
jgi:putative peptidoglycan lipid II flippase